MTRRVLSPPKIRAARDRAGFTRQQVAERVRCSTSTVQNAETGDRRVNAETLADLAVLYGVALEEFYEARPDNDDAPPEDRLAATTSAGGA